MTTRLKKWGKRNKFNVAPRPERTVDGKTFASKREAARYKELRLLEALGEIHNLVCQPKFPIVIDGKPVLGANKHPLVYTADFEYETDGGVVYEDVKGVMARDAALRIAIVEAIYNVKIRIVK